MKMPGFHCPGTFSPVRHFTCFRIGILRPLPQRLRQFFLRWIEILLAVTFCCGVPAGAAERFVNPSNPVAQDVGQGTRAAPYRTLKFAMSQLQPGDRLEIAEGVYREALVFPAWTTEALGTTRTLVEGKGKVVIKGSVLVTDWKHLGSGRFVKPWPQETSQVFVDGNLLQQIGGTILGGVPTIKMWPGRVAGNQDSMPPGSFYYERIGTTGGNLYVRVAGSTLAGRLVEVSTLAHTLLGKNLTGVTVRNLEFEHGNTSHTDRNGLILMVGKNIWLDRIKVYRCDTIGIELDGDDNKLTNSSANDCGQLGLKARGKRVQIRDNETSRNNLRRFNKWQEAGGAKFVGARGLQDSVVIGHKSIGNLADGIWFDWHNNSNRIERGLFAYNTGFGIHYEASHNAIIVDNIAVGNEQRGIYLLHSAYSVVAFNLVAGNKLQGIVIVDEGSRDPAGVMDLKPVSNTVFGNVVAWNKGALTLPLDLANNRSNANLMIGAPLDTTYSLGWSTMYRNLPDWVTRTGQDSNSQFSSVTGDAGAPSLNGAKDGSSYIEWYKAFRATAEPLPVDPAWMKRLPQPSRDTRPGPAW